MKKILCTCLVTALCLCLCSCKSTDYKDAMAHYEAGEYTQAMDAFEALGDYKDSLQMIKKCNYGIAISLMESGQYEDAITVFEALSDYEDSVQKIADCELAIRYNDAIALMDAGCFEEAIAVFEALDGYKNSANLIKNCHTAIMDSKYNDAVALMDHDLVQAFEALIALDGYKDSAQKANSIYEKYETEKIKTAQVGEYILFGTYEQDNNYSNGNEYVEWLVLEKTHNKMLVLSKYALDCKEYNDGLLKKVTWGTCSLKKWLNDTFVTNAFSATEQSVITKTGNGKVFLLSRSEVARYFDADHTRECKPTDYAVAHGAYVDSDSGICRWWVRGDDFTNQHWAIFKDNSYVTRDPEWRGIIYLDFAVRPAMWISIES